jgi:hypothetical protein
MSLIRTVIHPDLSSVNLWGCLELLIIELTLIEQLTIRTIALFNVFTSPSAMSTLAKHTPLAVKGHIISL